MKKTNNKGFSLVELIIVIAIMAILIGVLAPQYLKYVEKSRVSADKDLVDSIYNACTTAASDADINDAPTGGAVIHSRKAVMDYLEETNYYKSCDFIATFAERLINSKVFPVEQEIPGNMKEEIEYYFGRKERPF